MTVCLLVFVLLPFIPDALVRPRNGARRWISLGVTDVQPSELAKIAWIALMAEWLVRRRTYRRFGGFLLCFLDEAEGSERSAGSSRKSQENITKTEKNIAKHIKN